MLAADDVTVTPSFNWVPRITLAPPHQVRGGVWSVVPVHRNVQRPRRSGYLQSRGLGGDFGFALPLGAGRSASGPQQGCHYYGYDDKSQCTGSQHIGCETTGCRRPAMRLPRVGHQVQPTFSAHLPRLSHPQLTAMALSVGDDIHVVRQRRTVYRLNKLATDSCWWLGSMGYFWFDFRNIFCTGAGITSYLIDRYGALADSTMQS